MTWEYALIGLVVGIVIGAIAMRFGNRKLRQQQVLQNELEKVKRVGAISPRTGEPLCSQRRVT